MKTFLGKFEAGNLHINVGNIFRQFLLMQRIPTNGSAVIWDYKRIKEERAKLVKFYQKLTRGK